MKKWILLVLLLMLPFGVFAKDNCNNDDISISKIELLDTSGKGKELSEVEVKGQNIKFNLKFNKIADKVKYKILLKNNSSDEYQLNEQGFKSNSKNLDYKLIYTDDSKIIEAGKEKEILLEISYKNEVEKTSFVGNEYALDDEITFNVIKSSQDNPITKTGIILFIVLFVLLLFILFKYRKIKTMVIFVLCIPVLVSAVCNIQFNIKTHVVFEKSPIRKCYFNGELIKGAEYEDGQYIYRYLVQPTFSGNKWEDMDDEGWSIRVKDRESTEPLVSEMCTYINDIPVTSMKGTFSRSKATSVDLSSFNTSNITNMAVTFFATLFEDIDLSGFDTHNVKTMQGMLSYIDDHDINLSGFDTSKVENMQNMFGSDSFEKLDLSNFDTSNVLYMATMFSKCNINDLDLSMLDTSNVQDMESMFEEFEGNVNLKGLNTSNVTKMAKMFHKAKIESVDFSTFDTRKVTNMNGMFGYSSMEKIDVSSFKIDSLESVNTLFYYANAREIDISGFDTNTLREAINMFVHCDNLETVYASDSFDGTVLVDTPGSPNFSSDNKIIGGEGTVCASLGTGSTDHNNMKVDHGAANPGCFTLK